MWRHFELSNCEREQEFKKRCRLNLRDTATNNRSQWILWWVSRDHRIGWLRNNKKLVKRERVHFEDWDVHHKQVMWNHTANGFSDFGHLRFVGIHDSSRFIYLSISISEGKKKQGFTPRQNPRPIGPSSLDLMKLLDVTAFNPKVNDPITSFKYAYYPRTAKIIRMFWNRNHHHYKSIIIYIYRF